MSKHPFTNEDDIILTSYSPRHTKALQDILFKCGYELYDERFNHRYYCNYKLSSKTVIHMKYETGVVESEGD